MLDRDQRWQIMAQLTELGAMEGFVAVGGFWAVQTLATADALSLTTAIGAIAMGLGAGMINGVLIGALFGWAVCGLVLALDAPSRFSAAFNGAVLHGAFGAVIAFAVGRAATPSALIWIVIGWLVFAVLGARLGTRARVAMLQRLQQR
jgi:hypothetical protein